SSTNSSSSSLSQIFANIISVIQEQFSDIFDRIKDVNDYSLDQMCAVVSVDIFRLWMGVIGKDTIKGFYHGKNIKTENLKKIDA
ncbi:14107_t:CDS:1, partial [Funneliformis geosporum]